MRSATTVLLVGTLSLGLVAGGVTAASASGMRESSERLSVAAGETNKRFNGEDLFRGVVFGQGKARKLLGDLRAHVEITPDVELEIDRIVADIQAKNAGFFLEFGAKAQSGGVRNGSVTTDR